LYVGAGLAEQCDLVRGAAEDCFVMAVAVDEDSLALEAMRDGVGGLCGEEVGEEPDVLAKKLCAGIVGE